MKTYYIYDVNCDCASGTVARTKEAGIQMRCPYCNRMVGMMSFRFVRKVRANGDMEAMQICRELKEKEPSLWDKLELWLKETKFEGSKCCDGTAIKIRKEVERCKKYYESLDILKRWLWDAYHESGSECCNAVIKQVLWKIREFQNEG